MTFICENWGAPIWIIVFSGCFFVLSILSAIRWIILKKKHMLYYNPEATALAFVPLLFLCSLGALYTSFLVEREQVVKQMEEYAEIQFKKNYPEKIKSVKGNLNESIKVQTFSNEVYVLPVKEITSNEWVVDSIFIKEKNN